MAEKDVYSDAVVEILKDNPNVFSITNRKIVYTLEFKQKVISEAEKGKRSTQIFSEAGLTPELVGRKRIYEALKHIKMQAESEQGLKKPRGKSREDLMKEFAEKDLSKQKTDESIKELQDRIAHLEQVVEFLKKTRIPTD